MEHDQIPPPRPHRWPEGAVVYQIYPRSLQDSNGDGIGDLEGITSRLDYIRDLGVSTVWLSPFYPSPMADFGYDVADYRDVDPIFGSLSDFDRMLQTAHEMDLKVMVDLVPNHTSDAHEWFQQSRLSRDNPYADWYIWRDARHNTAEGEHLPPNNWRDALTGGPAWQWDEARSQFYLHSFDVRQPDLNWGNPRVRAAMKDVMRFWLDKGVDGFRVDAVLWLGKEPLLHNDTPNPDYVEGEDLLYDAVQHDNSRGWPSMYAYLSEMADVLQEPQYQDSPRFMVTEAYPDRHNPIAAYLNFYASVDPAVAAPFNFEGVSLPWKAGAWRRFLRTFHRALELLDPDCVASYAFGNHDKPRLVSRLGESAARAAAVMEMTLPGMAFVYYGEEIGMHDVLVPPESVHDPAAKGDPKHGVGRDPERTPMQWDDGPNAGFSSGQSTWLPLPPDYHERTVAAEAEDPHSFLSLYRRLIALRRGSLALKHGDLTMVETGHPDVVGFIRRSPEEAAGYLTLVNFSETAADYEIDGYGKELVLSSDPSSGAAGSSPDRLAPYEAVVYRIT